MQICGFCTLLVAILAPCACLGQTISVTLGANSAGSACTFAASSLMDGFTSDFTIGSASTGAVPPKVTASPVTIVKKVDNCSIPLVLDLFRGASIPTVTINITGDVSGGTGPLVTITLTTAFATAISDSDAKGEAAPAEKVTLVYEKITTTDHVNNTSVTCDLLTHLCSSGTAG